MREDPMNYYRLVNLVAGFWLLVAAVFWGPVVGSDDWLDYVLQVAMAAVGLYALHEAVRDDAV